MAKRPNGPRTKNVIAVTFQIVKTAHTHDLSHNIDADASRRKRGDIVEFVRTDRFATWNDVDGKWQWNTPILSPNLVFIHARGFDQSRFLKAKKRFTEDLTVNNIGRIDESDEDADCARRSRWLIRYADLPNPVKSDLNTFKEATMAWTNLQPLTRKRTFVVRHDPSQDDETQAATDEDVPEDVVVTL